MGRGLDLWRRRMLPKPKPSRLLQALVASFILVELAFAVALAAFFLRR